MRSRLAPMGGTYAVFLLCVAVTAALCGCSPRRDGSSGGASAPGAIGVGGPTAPTATPDAATPDAAAPDGAPGAAPDDRPTAGPGGEEPRASGAFGIGAMVVSVRVTSVIDGRLTAELKTSGTVCPVMQSQVVGQTSGVVSRVLHRAGDWVQGGDIVVQLDDTQLTLSLKTAQAALSSAQITLATKQGVTAQAAPKLQLAVKSAESALASATRTCQSQKTLFDMGSVTAADLDKAQSALASAQATLEGAKMDLDQNEKAGVQDLAQLELAADQAGYQVQQAELNLRNAAIRAPFDGVLVAIRLNPGEYANGNTPAFTIASRERELDFTVPPSEAASLPVGAEVRFDL
ncbi:MAG TPA: HlyD family efflux transporter periplasmic adaptor subunit, partial [Spirochaetia bacterium]|nr:HlyD family efflux transporter periplasmic adaptor subunit [Spirochaetia bacterium]